MAEAFEDNVTEIVEGGRGSLGDVVMDTFIGQINEKAKVIVGAGFDYILSLMLVFLQASGCTLAIDPSDVYNTLNETIRGGDSSMKDNVTDFFDFSGNKTLEINETTIENLDFSDLLNCDLGKTFRLDNIELVITILCLAYGLFASIGIWIHASFVQKAGKSTLEGIYKCTDRIPILDSLFEIPIALYIAPIATIFLWLIFSVCCGGLLFVILGFSRNSDKTAQVNAFIFTNFMVGFHLYKLTGDISQYYVLNKTSIADEDEKRQILGHIASYQNRSFKNKSQKSLIE